ncbi:MAG: FkbM family methyltransferase [Bacteroidales bacterium]
MSTLNKILPERLYKIILSFYQKYFATFRNNSYSQEGEDLIIKRIFENKHSGFYVDVGAHHPKRFSNTYLFYKQGWRGINIEPRPGSKKLFDKFRKRDINIEVAISEYESNLIYFEFDDAALNSFDQKLSIERANKTKYKIINKLPIKTYKLADILDNYLPTGQKIDFLTIDTEGFDIHVLRSNNWERYRPEIILCEDSEFELSNPEKSEIYKFLIQKHYILLAKTLSTLIFKSK